MTAIIGFDNGLMPNCRQVIIWTNADPIRWHMDAVLGGYVLMHIPFSAGVKDLSHVFLAIVDHHT